MCHLNQNRIIRLKNLAICFSNKTSKAKTTDRNGNSCYSFILRFIFNYKSGGIRTSLVKSVRCCTLCHCNSHTINNPTIGNNTNIISRTATIKSNAFSYLNSNRSGNSNCYRRAFIFNKININIISQLIRNLFGCQLCPI